MQATAKDTDAPVADSIEEALSIRVAALAEWIAENAPELAAEQKHLDVGTPERAYWHHGYMAALRDVQNCLVGKKRRAN